MENQAWAGFKGGAWEQNIDVRGFLQNNYRPYEGGAEFLAQATPRTKKLLHEVHMIVREELDNNGVRSIDTDTIMGITAFAPGYVDKEAEIIVGVQTDVPLKRGCNPFGGMRMVRDACAAYGYQVSDKIEQAFANHMTHNDGVFAAYSEDVRLARHSGLITGLPDAYGRGRIIGDYRRVPLYGVEALLAAKKADKAALEQKDMTSPNMRACEEHMKQIKALGDMVTMAASYGFDITRPAQNGREAVQWLYFAYLAAIKEQNGAAMSLGRTSTFLDIYFERDLANGTLTESGVQEIIDDFVLKLRMARHLRTPSYNELFGGDPMWITEALGGTGEDGRTLVTKSSYRFLHTLYTLGTAPEPNLTVLWSESSPETWKNFTAKVSIDTDSIQYENDDIMRPVYGDDYAIACCVSAMKIGKQMQFFGARANLAKLMLMSLNGGVDEIKGTQVGPKHAPYEGEYLEYDKVCALMDYYLPWLAHTYVSALNVIHYMHDKYAYESAQMSLHDADVHRFMACGVAGMSVLADSLSAIKYAKVKCVRDAASGLITDFITEGDFPKFGNDDDRVDLIAAEQIEKFRDVISKESTYRDSEITLSILTITSNVMYGKKTGSTPDGRKRGEAFAPGANPMSGREASGALAALNSVAKIKYDVCRDGISNTFSIVPDALGKTDTERVQNLAGLLGGYFAQGAHHLNVNVLNRDELILAYNDPEKYPGLTIRVSGYAVNFVRLSKEQQREVISRTFHIAV